ncbi:1-acyl-sn-glycerol-3-phosphate acyltransferase [Granulicella aggregans]|uniref:1-acyl-sn-glycerol-3-phosphate acyltransferase n=1 Tax=Granulicella aggregans TaxID=474949 RepID=A0A7W7Z991_9BACT|nr:lysophospholipid acyltransferase family protein [Granulicella aggregans]MBB5055704.1 1-acyl-sn-glycerol-3-phosphate acyltransferase [Granulicella aggregans]
MVVRFFRSLTRSLLLVALLLAATVDLWIRRPKYGAGGAIWIHGWCRRIVSAMGIKVTVTGWLPESGAVVSNHLSYLDILLYSATRPFIMVAKSEIKGWPLLGRLTAQAGTVYVDRGGGPPTYPAVNRAMAAAYQRGLPVLFFPEGTTTNGEGVLPFRRGLFHSVLNNGIVMRTAALRLSIHGENGAAIVADDVCWWGDAYFGPHIFKCLGLEGLAAQIDFNDTPVEGADRFVLSENAQARVAESYAALAAEGVFTANLQIHREVAISA